jgi:hypothetical protein
VGALAYDATTKRFAIPVSSAGVSATIIIKP